jgi:hypothetical protein
VSDASLTELVTPRERPLRFHGRSIRGILDGRKTQTRRPLTPQPEPFERVDPITGNDYSGVWWSCHLPGGEGTMIVLETDHPGRGSEHDHAASLCPIVQAGDRAYARETHRAGTEVKNGGGTPVIVYRADGAHRHPENADWTDEQETEILEWFAEEFYKQDPGHPLDYDEDEFGWRPSIHMPKWATRIWLRIEDVRVERLNEMSRGDAYAEGVAPADYDHRDITRPEQTPIACFRRRWNETYDEDGLRWRDNPWVWTITFGIEDVLAREPQPAHDEPARKNESEEQHD